MRLSAREKTVVTLGAALLGIIVIWLVVIDPIHNNIVINEQKLVSHERQFSEIQRLAIRYSELQAGLSATEKQLKRSGGSSILSHLEAQAQRLNVKNHIVQMKPMQGQSTRNYKESVVEIKMEKVSLALLVRFLHQVENSTELLRIKELRIRPRFDNPNLLDVRIQVSSYALSEPA